MNHTSEFRECCIWIDTNYSIIGEHRVLDRVVSERYILKNTESIVPGLIQTKVFLENIEF